MYTALLHDVMNEINANWDTAYSFFAKSPIFFKAT
jgi:hypothetical protein